MAGRHISGGEGWSANTTCKRVLVLHADGSQTVQVRQGHVAFFRAPLGYLVSPCSAFLTFSVRNSSVQQEIKDDFDIKPEQYKEKLAAQGVTDVK